MKPKNYRNAVTVYVFGGIDPDVNSQILMHPIDSGINDSYDDATATGTYLPRPRGLYLLKRPLL
jgi:hypothetical protein